MSKDYFRWHGLKSKIEREKFFVPFNVQEIWWCCLGANIGTEQDGKHQMFDRPVLIIKKFSKEMFWGLPLSSRVKEGPYYINIHVHNQLNSVILSQIRLFSAKRLVRRMVTISDKKFKEICEAVGKLAISDIIVR